MKPGLVAAGALFVEALLIDVVLAKRGHDSISTCVRENEHARRVVRWASAHLTDSVRGDLLSLVGSRFFS